MIWNNQFYLEKQYLEMTLKLYGVPLSPFARMAHAVAELTNNEYEYIKESLSDGQSIVDC